MLGDMAAVLAGVGGVHVYCRVRQARTAGADDDAPESTVTLRANSRGPRWPVGQADVRNGLIVFEPPNTTMAFRNGVSGS